MTYRILQSMHQLKYMTGTETFVADHLKCLSTFECDKNNPFNIGNFLKKTSSKDHQKLHLLRLFESTKYGAHSEQIFDQSVFIPKHIDVSNGYFKRMNKHAAYNNSSVSTDIQTNTSNITKSKLSKKTTKRKYTDSHHSRTSSAKRLRSKSEPKVECSGLTTSRDITAITDEEAVTANDTLTESKCVVSKMLLKPTHVEVGIDQTRSKRSSENRIQIKNCGNRGLRQSSNYLMHTPLTIYNPKRFKQTTSTTPDNVNRSTTTALSLNAIDLKSNATVSPSAIGSISGDTRQRFLQTRTPQLPRTSPKRILRLSGIKRSNSCEQPIGNTFLTGYARTDITPKFLAMKTSSVTSEEGVYLTAKSGEVHKICSEGGLDLCAAPFPSLVNHSAKQLSTREMRMSMNDVSQHSGFELFDIKYNPPVATQAAPNYQSICLESLGDVCLGMKNRPFLEVHRSTSLNCEHSKSTVKNRRDVLHFSDDFLSCATETLSGFTMDSMPKQTPKGVEVPCSPLQIDTASGVTPTEICSPNSLSEVIKDFLVPDSKTKSTVLKISSRDNPYLAHGNERNFLGRLLGKPMKNVQNLKSREDEIHKKIKPKLPEVSIQNMKDKPEMLQGSGASKFSAIHKSVQQHRPICSGLVFFRAQEARAPSGPVRIRSKKIRDETSKPVSINSKETVMVPLQLTLNRSDSTFLVKPELYPSENWLEQPPVEQKKHQQQYQRLRTKAAVATVKINPEPKSQDAASQTTTIAMEVTDKAIAATTTSKHHFSTTSNIPFQTRSRLVSQGSDSFKGYRKSYDRFQRIKCPPIQLPIAAAHAIPYRFRASHNYLAQLNSEYQLFGDRKRKQVDQHRLNYFSNTTRPFHRIPPWYRPWGSTRMRYAESAHTSQTSVQQLTDQSNDYVKGKMEVYFDNRSKGIHSKRCQSVPITLKALFSSDQNQRCSRLHGKRHADKKGNLNASVSTSTDWINPISAMDQCEVQLVKLVENDTKADLLIESHGKHSKQPIHQFLESEEKIENSAPDKELKPEQKKTEIDPDSTVYEIDKTIIEPSVSVAYFPSNDNILNNRKSQEYKLLEERLNTALQGTFERMLLELSKQSKREYAGGLISVNETDMLQSGTAVSFVFNKTKPEQEIISACNLVDSITFAPYTEIPLKVDDNSIKNAEMNHRCLLRATGEFKSRKECDGLIEIEKPKDYDKKTPYPLCCCTPWRKVERKVSQS